MGDFHWMLGYAVLAQNAFLLWGTNEEDHLGWGQDSITQEH